MTKLSCATCSMPLENPSDVGTTIGKDSFCIHCTDQNKNLKSCQEIFDGGVQFFLSVLPDMPKDFAEKIVRKNMNFLPYWKTNFDACLNGPEASEQEFKDVLKRLK